MAIPSTVNPTASGKEVLRRTFIDGQNETLTTILTVPTDHICTILSINFCEVSSEADAKAHIVVKPDGGADFHIMTNQPIGVNGTFVYSEKLVLTGGDLLQVKFGGSGTITGDVWVSYIDQDWS